MLHKLIRYSIPTLCLLAFFTSRGGLSARLQAPNFNSLLAETKQKPVGDEVLQQFLRGGIPALDRLLQDFEQSDFSRSTRQRLKAGFNLGLAIDRDIYASNVVAVAEAFGPIGIDRLLNRLPTSLVKFFQLDSQDFSNLGTGTVKPLLVVNMLKNPSQEELARVRDWVGTFSQEQRVVVSVDEKALRASTQIQELAPFWGGIVAGLVSKAVWEVGTWLVQRYRDGGPADDSDGLTSVYRIRKNVPEDYWLSQLSPLERRRVLLRQLNPSDPRLRTVPSAHQR